jgi:hypothetical protein
MSDSREFMFRVVASISFPTFKKIWHRCIQDWHILGVRYLGQQISTEVSEDIDNDG